MDIVAVRERLAAIKRELDQMATALYAQAATMECPEADACGHIINAMDEISASASDLSVALRERRTQWVPEPWELPGHGVWGG